MGIQDKVLTYKFHIIFMLIMSITLVSLIFVAPSFLTILAYFWPLLLSTALFLGAVIFFGSNNNSLPATDSSGDSKPPGEGILDYVAGQPEQPVESLTSE